MKFPNWGSKMAKIERVYFHYEDTEEFHAGMWRIVRGEERKRFANAAADLMRDSDQFKAEMLRATQEWPNSTLGALTADGVNKIAWLGHAGCCVSTGSPEECTRVGWHMLDQGEQDEANRVAQEVLEWWEARHSYSLQPSLFGAPC